MPRPRKGEEKNRDRMAAFRMCADVRDDLEKLAKRQKVSQGDIIHAALVKYIPAQNRKLDNAKKPKTSEAN